MVNGVYGDAFILGNGKIYQRGFVIVNGPHLVLVFHRETLWLRGFQISLLVASSFPKATHLLTSSARSWAT